MELACKGSDDREASVPDAYRVTRVDDASYPYTSASMSLVALQAASIIHSAAGERAGVSCKLGSS